MPDHINHISTNNMSHSSGAAGEMTTGARFIGLLDNVVNRSFDFMNKHTPVILATGVTGYCVKNEHYYLSAIGLFTMLAVSRVSNGSKQKFEITGIGHKLNGINFPSKTDNNSQKNLGETDNRAKTDVSIQLDSPATALP